MPSSAEPFARDFAAAEPTVTLARQQRVVAFVAGEPQLDAGNRDLAAIDRPGLQLTPAVAQHLERITRRQVRINEPPQRRVDEEGCTVFLSQKGNLLALQSEDARRPVHVLAEELTRTVHGPEALARAQNATRVLFDKNADWRQLSAQELAEKAREEA